MNESLIYTMIFILRDIILGNKRTVINPQNESLAILILYILFVLLINFFGRRYTKQLFEFKFNFNSWFMAGINLFLLVSFFRMFK